MLRDAQAQGSLSLIRSADLGVVAQPDHNMAFEMVLPTQAKVWYYPVGSFASSAVMCVRLKHPTVGVGLNSHSYFELLRDTEPIMFSIFSLAKMRACSIKLRSWAWQWLHVPIMRKGKPAAIRAFRDGPIEGVLNIACRNAFWLSCRATVVRFADEAHVGVPSGSSLFEVLFLVITSVLKCSSEVAMDYIHKRIGSMRDNTMFSKELLNIDDAIQCLDHNDLQACIECQKQAVQLLEERSTFIEHYSERKREIVAAAGAAGGGAGGGAAHGGKKYPAVMPLTFEQKDVKLFLPPVASCWRGNKRQEWWGHFKPNPRVVKNVRDYEDEDQTIKAMLQAMWMHYNEKEGRPLHEGGSCCRIVC
jgi:hypothetical protein